MVKKVKNIENEVLSYRHLDRRKNNPEVGMVSPDTDPDEPKTLYSYDPHIDPSLQFDSDRFQIEKLIDDALISGDEEVMKNALQQLKRQQSPYLNWAGKAERTSFEVDTVSLHVHERIDPASILSVVRKNIEKEKKNKKQAPSGQMGLFNAPFENLPLRDAIDFYKHDRGWANRLIAGDSLLVMNSLIQKEGMAGQLQMVFFDPPYGIKYGSNFQPFIDKRDVKDGKDEDLTQEPEMLKAFRDTWELGIHSYLTYLKDRIKLSHELLNETGSIFIQISNENVHLVRSLLDEVFGSENHVSDIVFQKSGGTSGSLLSGVFDYLIWYAKDKKKIKYNQLLADKTTSEKLISSYSYEDPQRGAYRYAPVNSQGWSSNRSSPINHLGKEYSPGSNRHWSVDPKKIEKLIEMGYVTISGNSVYQKIFLNFQPGIEITNLWSDTARGSFNEPLVYVVQTTTKTIERCMLMTTSPGDLVFDPTCGSGSTAYVAEKLGRRWITCDSSRIALTIAKQRLMTASFDYYELKYPHEGLKGGFIYQSVPHITLKNIAENAEIENIYEQYINELKSGVLDILNNLRKSGVKEIKIPDGSRRGDLISIENDDCINHFEISSYFPKEWPEECLEAFNKFLDTRNIFYSKMDGSINAHADKEQLFDKPAIDSTKLRITGPFTVEAVPSPMVQNLDESVENSDIDNSVSKSGGSKRHHDWKDELIKTGIRGKNNQMLMLSDLETLPDVRYLHASGVVAETGERVVVSFGPEYSLLEQRQVEMAMREAGDLFPRPKMILFCGFDFDPEAAKDIDNTKGIIALRVKMNADLLTMDLKKQKSSNQSFWLMGQPDVEVRKTKDDLWQVEVHGFDYFDTVKGELVSGGKGNISAWMLDTDYDSRSLFPRQVFFPMAGVKDGWHRLKKEIRAELDESALKQFHGTISIPFEAGESGRIAVKIVDDRGIESLKVLDLIG